MNIGFETGDFRNWECDTGHIKSDGSIHLNRLHAVPGVHTILKNTYPQQKDQFGDFPVNCPNGSGYSIMLGNSNTGNKAESVSYTFTVPTNVQDYSIIYNYAVVLQNPSHADYQQPKFQTKVYDVTQGRYIDCGSFQFVASPDLPGFMQSTRARDVFYKPWSPITINLFGYAGRTIRLEFISNDCTLGGHFGYAYLDVNENCASPISGNTYCAGAKNLTLTAPYGFKEYRWYNADFSTLLGTDNILKISPPPPGNTGYALEIIPYPGLGCLDTVTTTINASTDVFDLNVSETITGCESGVDITAKHVTEGSTSNIKYSYFLEENQLNYLPTPGVVTKSGTYFIKGVGPSGCNDIKPIKVLLKDPPKIEIKDPGPVCHPNKVDITAASIVQGSDANLAYSYWQSLDTANRLLNAKAIDASGRYYIKGTNEYGCSEIKPVNVRIGTLPTIKTKSITGCDNINLTTGVASFVAASTLTYTYWEDAAASRSIASPENIKSSGNYYIKGTDELGCATTEIVPVTVNPNPVFTATDPLPVTYPATVDLTKSVTASPNLTYSYWADARGTRLTPQPRVINTSGTYYIKGTNAFNCSIISPVKVVINPPPLPAIIVPNAFSPNGDGINDVFRISIDGVVNIESLRIFNRSGQLLHETTNINGWDGKWNGKDLPVGTYYWILEYTDIFRSAKGLKSGAITLLR